LVTRLLLLNNENNRMKRVGRIYRIKRVGRCYGGKSRGKTESPERKG
jgi:hypothetical protein